MLFLVISSPRPERPSTQRAARESFWPWIENLKSRHLARWCYARPGRGAATLFDVPSIEVLHDLLTQWSEMVPAQFETYPLIEAAAATAYLAGGAAKKPRKRA